MDINNLLSFNLRDIKYYAFIKESHPECITELHPDGQISIVASDNMQGYFYFFYFNSDLKEITFNQTRKITDMVHIERQEIILEDEYTLNPETKLGENIPLCFILAYMRIITNDE